MNGGGNPLAVSTQTLGKNWGESQLTQRTKPPNLASLRKLKIRWRRGPTQPLQEKNLLCRFHFM